MLKNIISLLINNFGKTVASALAGAAVCVFGVRVTGEGGERQNLVGWQEMGEKSRESSANPFVEKAGKFRYNILKGNEGFERQSNR